MLKVAICDDEQVYLERTCAMLEQYAAEQDVEVTAETFVNSSALLDSIEAGARCDIYLLDIYMPGVSGMSVATELRSRGVRSPIIFLTSSTEHAVEAFGVDATHYLLKPYTQPNFFAAGHADAELLLDPYCTPHPVLCDHHGECAEKGLPVFQLRQHLHLLQHDVHHCKYPTAKRIAERRACPRPYGADAGAALCRAAAILLEIQPDLSPAQVRELLCTTANGQNLDLDSALQYFREEKDSVLD